MLAYQAIEYYKYLLEKLESMTDLLNPIEVFSDKYMGLKDSLSSRVFTLGKVSFSGNDTIYTIGAEKYDMVSDYNTNFQQMVGSFNLISFLPLWHDIQKDVSSYQISNNIEDTFYNNYVKSIDSILDGLQAFYQSNSKPNRHKLSENILNSTQQRRYIFSHYYDALNMVSCKTLQEHEIVDNNVFLSIQLLQINLTLEDFAAILSGIDTVYQQISRLINVSTKLEIIKIESGSLLSKILGDENVISAIGSLLNKFVDLIFKKFTHEGQIARQVDAMAAIRECAELNDLLSSNGIDTSETNTALIEANGIIAKNLLLFAKKGGPKIKINDNIHSIDATFAGKYLESTQIALLKEGTDTYTSESV